jgi:KRAB domain-containing zinc finger protein
VIQARKDPDYSTDGEVRDKTLKDKLNLKEHINPGNPKTYECENCDETFTESWKMEEHLELHGNVRPFKCSICEKGFYMKWRMEKHTRRYQILPLFQQ